MRRSRIRSTGWFAAYPRLCWRSQIEGVQEFQQMVFADVWFGHLAGELVKVVTHQVKPTGHSRPTGTFRIAFNPGIIPQSDFPAGNQLASSSDGAIQRCIK